MKNELIAFLTKKRLLFWDFDGTLVNSEPIYYEAFQRAFAAAEIKITPTYFYETISFRGKKASQILKEHDATANESTVLALISKIITDATEAKHFKIFPEVRSILTAARDLGLKQAIVSNSKSTQIEKILVQNDILHLFDNIFGRDTTIVPKPSAEPYRYALRCMEASDNETLVFEDTETGLLSAQAAGIDAVCLSTQSNNGFQTSARHIDRLSHLEIFQTLRLTTTGR